MTMDVNFGFLEKQLYRTESDSLDWKRESYPFEGASNDDKSQLLKDILAFANSWCVGEAFIFLGIEEREIKPHEIVGINDHIDDAKLQQFEGVNYFV